MKILSYRDIMAANDAKMDNYYEHIADVDPEYDAYLALTYNSDN